MVIDDSAAVRRAVEAVLAGAGYGVETASSTAPLQAALEGEAPVDLLILDLWMPGQGGLEFLRQMRRSWKDLPVLIISGGGTDMSLEHATALAEIRGAHGVLIKPFANSELLSAVREAMGG
ncbi:MAG: response regulator [Pseudomonadota bacterium]